MTLELQSVYQSGDPAFFPAIRAREQVPAELRARSVQGQMRFVAGSVVQIIALLMTGQLVIRQSFELRGGVQEAVLHVMDHSGPESSSSLRVEDALVFNALRDRPARAALLLLVAAHSHNLYPEIRAAWELMLRAVTDQGRALPLDPSVMKASSPQLKPAMLRLADILTYTAETVADSAQVTDHATRDPGDDVTVLILSGQSLPQPSMLAAGEDDAQTLTDLIRWTRRGLNVFLTGPTGTFKTTTANRAALANGANLFSVQGRPGLEDRDFYGGVYPTEHGPQWRPGPVAQAFDSAASGALTVIVFNEVTRFEPLYFNATIGMMDELSGDELAAHGVVFLPEDLHRIGLATQTEGRFYLLSLPNGTAIACRKELLSFVGTANLGSDYVTTGELDSALLRRYDRHVEMEPPQESVVMPLLLQAAGTPALARVGYDLELHTRTQVVDEFGQSDSGDPEGLLKRPMNFSTTRALLDEARELIEVGLPPQSAFIRAARTTAVAYCVPRQPNGSLDPAAKQRLEDDIHRFSMRLG